MVVDSSALLAILLNEPERAAFLQKLSEADNVLLSTATFLEIFIVYAGRVGPSEIAELEDLLETFSITLVAFTPEQSLEAQQAWLQFGKGNHKAKLNFGDCFSYALSKVSRQPLLFKGKDFAHTDLARA